MTKKQTRLAAIHALSPAKKLRLICLLMSEVEELYALANEQNLAPASLIDDIINKAAQETKP